MIFLQEEALVEDVQVITEANENGTKKYFIEGIFLQSNIANKNRRFYPKEIMAREVDRYVQEFVNENRAYGELGHPAGPTVNLDRVSHMIVSLKEDGDNYIGKAKITASTPMGAIAKAILDEGGKLGVSSRGMGSLKPNREGINEVQDDFMLATAGDIVADPSAPNAFVRGIMENRDWMIVEGKWGDKEFEQAKRMVEAANRRQLQEVQMRLFEEFLRKLA